MKPFEMPQIVYLKGEDAVEALSMFVEELEEKRGNELTDRQVDALIRIAKELKDNIETRTQAHSLAGKNLSPSGSLTRLFRPITKFF